MSIKLLKEKTTLGNNKWSVNHAGIKAIVKETESMQIQVHLSRKPAVLSDRKARNVIAEYFLNNL